MITIIEDFELTDANGYWFATAPEIEVEIEISHEWSWHIATVSLIGQKHNERKVVRVFDLMNSPVEFSRMRADLMVTSGKYLQGCVSEHLEDERYSRADTAADRRRNADLEVA